MPSNEIMENKLAYFFKNSFVSLFAIVLGSLFIRILLFPANIPLTLDGIDYFWYASDTSALGHFPNSYGIANNGWPTFLSFFFTIFHYNNFIDLMNLQRALSVSLSVLTIIPVYLLCRKFIESPYALVGALVFAFDPRIIQNSLLGITEPLYILLLSSAFALYFSKSRFVYISFVLVGLASIVRAEAMFVFLPMIIMFYIRSRKEKKIILKTSIAIAIFVLLLLPVAIFRISIQGSDTLTGRVVEGVNQVITSSHNTGVPTFLKIAIENIIKLGAWSLVPIFIILLPIGLYFFIKERDISKITILVIIVLMILPIFYALAFNSDTRYMYPLFPLFSIISAFTIKKAIGKSRHHFIYLALIIGVILFSSTAFIEIKKLDVEHQKEAYNIGYQVTSLAKGVNEYYPESSYIEPVEIQQKYPVLKSDMQYQVSIIPTQGFDSLEKYIQSSKSKGLTHLVLDGSNNRSAFLNDVYYHGEKYPYLIKVFDSSDNGYKYHVKIYKIDYNAFDKMLIQDK